MIKNIWREEFMHHRLASEAEDRERQRAIELAAPTYPALVQKIKDARTLSHDCWRNYHEKGFSNQRHYAAGQLDAFDAVLMWIKEAQWNHDSTAPHNAIPEPKE